MRVDDTSASFTRPIVCLIMRKLVDYCNLLWVYRASLLLRIRHTHIHTDRETERDRERTKYFTRHIDPRDGSDLCVIIVCSQIPARR